MSVGAAAYGREQPVNPSYAEASQELAGFLQPLLFTCEECEAPDLLHMCLGYHTPSHIFYEKSFR